MMKDEIKEYLKNKIKKNSLLFKIQKKKRIFISEFNTDNIKIILKYKSAYIIEYVKNGFKPKKTFLFYPDKPKAYLNLWKLCQICGVKISNNINKKADVVFSWENITFKEKYKKLEKKHDKVKIINLNCLDISKKNIEQKFKKVFGYDLGINPKKYKGLCVEKSNENYHHDGIILQCPISETKKEYVYEILIDNKDNKGLYYDMRVPIILNEIPFVMINKKTNKNRFLSKYEEVKKKPVNKYLNNNEIDKIKKFCNEIKMDYGELDVLRDYKSKKIFIVDANSTPAGPNRKIGDKNIKKMLKEIYQIFYKSIHT